MTELEKMQRAKMYIDKLTNGINPIDDIPAAETDVINNIRISRCLFYVSDILTSVIENGIAEPRQQRPKSDPFYISDEALTNFQYSESPISLSEIIRRINELIDTERMKKLSYKNVASWLLNIDVLVEKTDEDGKMKKFPTETGEQIGIFVSTKQGKYGIYKTVVYNLSAQHFIIDNIESVLAYC